MTDIADARNLIQIEETTTQAAVSESTMQKMGAAVNFVINNSTFSVGDIKMSALTVAQFQVLHGVTWLLMNGASVVGSEYESLTGNSSVPDMVTDKRFPRQSDSDGNLLTVESSANLAHAHRQQIQGDNGGGNNGLLGASYLVAPGGTPSITNAIVGDSISTANRTALNLNTTSSGGTESRPHNIYINYFIKINS